MDNKDGIEMSENLKETFTLIGKLVDIFKENKEFKDDIELQKIINDIETFNEEAQLENESK